MAGEPRQIATVRVLEIARNVVSEEIGVIEASRELTSLRHCFGPELKKNFLPFAGIDSETDHLPLGSVRREWNADALSAKDAEIARLEESDKQLAIEACHRLIIRLERD